ncbi:MAG TPA: CRISPR-associated helicase/endonuclease Cas3 [Bacteroidales bacterium]|nr:CRISPR-associated helicase/endonuclease Cas3 [Bacteroidales bacterium]
MNQKKAIAHIREDKEKQSLIDHLFGVAQQSFENANKLCMPKAGELIGLLHDFGKYSKAFQAYIGSATGLIDQDADEYVDAGKLKGKIDHSTAGAKYVWGEAKNQTIQIQVAAQMLSLCIASHHSGLIDCINPDGLNEFEKRMAKPDKKCHLTEVLEKAEVELINKTSSLISEKACFNSIIEVLQKISKINSNETLRRMQAGLLVRFLFSCLIDADRTDTADFEDEKRKKIHKYRNMPGWDLLIERLENHLLSFEKSPTKTPIDEIRKQISDACLQRAKSKTGVFTLTVPTGGGKTLASLRFALHHAKQNQLEKIFYIVPYTTIIDQNADVVRKILEQGKEEKGRIVLEHHSNLMPEKQSWKTKILTENWDVPVVFTTMVQFLETFFNGGTRSARRMHQLAKSVIIFDEIQALPVKTTHLYCNAINFLTRHCGSTVVLCTATQPLLNHVAEAKGKIDFSEVNEIIPNVETLFSDLKRVEVINKTKQHGWEVCEIANLAKELANESKSCLVIVNTKRFAREVYESFNKNEGITIFHLSTSMCPAHRMEKLNEIRQKLDNKEPLICVSTQLIEAGVDVDFGSVIRFVAGVDSIAQAAGRCNRNGKRNLGKVFVVNPKDENLDSLYDIKIGRDVSNRIFRELNDPNAILPRELIHPAVMKRYFQYYFYDRAVEMSYPVNIGREDNLLNLLSDNSLSVGEYQRINDNEPKIYFRQAFGTAGEHFKAIDAPTQGIVVPFSEKGKKIVSDLFSQFAVKQQFKLLRNAQQFTVNVFPNVIKKLNEQHAISLVPEIGVMVLNDARFYHSEFGLSTEVTSDYETLISK